MLSRAAGNALLKTLEEPPEHVVFVLATTEPYKLLDTIRSRTQRFDFHPVGSETLIKYLATIAERESFTVDHEALGSIASHAGGSVRDAMSLLEQVAALGGGEVTPAGVSRALGVADADSYGRLLDLVADGDAAGGITLVADLAAQGADLRRFVADAIAYLRGVFLAQYATNIEEVVDAPAETIEDWRERAEAISSSEVLRAIDVMSGALLELRDGREERLVVELAILRLTRPETVPDLEGVTVRIDRVERQLRGVGQGGHQPSAVRSHPAKDEADPIEESLPPERPFDNKPQAEDRKSTGTDRPAEVDIDSGELMSTTEGATPTSLLEFSDFERAWPAIVNQIRQDVGPRRHALLKEASPIGVENGAVVFEVASHMHFHLEQLKADAGIAAAISAAGADQLGQPISVAFRSSDAPQAVEAAEAEVVPDKDDLAESSNKGGEDVIDNVLDVLGGEIVGD